MTHIYTAADVLNLAPVMPVVTLEEPRKAESLARVLLAGGVQVVEVTLRGPHALEILEVIAAKVPEIVIGAGTVTTPESVHRAVDAGAQFLVSPGTTDSLLTAMEAAPIPCLPGVTTPTDMMRILERGQQEMKFFPAEASGGRAFLSAIAGPLPAARFCPTGGITASNAARYLELPNVSCVGGSWLTPRAALAADDWRRIETLARKSTTLGRPHAAGPRTS